MLSSIKKFLYFPLAHYFKFFAGIRLMRWNPKIILVTGSNGKTTLLSLIESQMGSLARYSHNANSSFGIPFDILDLHRKTLLKKEWFSLFLKAPFASLKKPPKEKIYVVEADCDRVREGKFLASFLRPSIVIWLSLAKTHSVNFEKLVSKKMFSSVESAIANEFGYFPEYAKELILANGDSYHINNQVKRTKARIIFFRKKNLLKKYYLDDQGSIFNIEGVEYKFRSLLPEEVFYSISATKKLCEIMNISFDQSFSKFNIPPGRGSIFKGIKHTTIIDSSYNISTGSAEAIISMFNSMNAKKKWLIIGDIIDLGKSTKEEHEKFAELIDKDEYEKIILMGPRVSKYTYSSLEKKITDKNKIHKFLEPNDALRYIMQSISGREVMLFKGARFMEGIIEHLLEDKRDIEKLPRREKAWQLRRKKWGL